MIGHLAPSQQLLALEFELGGAAGHVLLEDLVHDGVGHLFGHQAVGGQLAAQDRVESVAVVDDLEAAADRTAVTAAALEQRPHAGIGANQAGLAEDRQHLGGFTADQVDLAGLNPDLVGIAAGDRGGAGQADGLVGHDDVAVRGRPQTVDHQVGQTVVGDHQAALAEAHGHVVAGQLGDLAAPGAGGVDDHAGVDLLDLAAELVLGLDAHQPALLADELDDLVMDQDLAAAFLGADGVEHAESEGVDRGVRHEHGLFQRRVQVGHQLEGLGRREHLGRDADRGAALEELVTVGLGVARQPDEEALGFFHALTADSPEDLVFRDALVGGFLVVDHVAAARVQQAMAGAGGSSREVVLFDQAVVDASQAEIARQAAAGRAAADDDDVCLEHYANLPWVSDLMAGPGSGPTNF
ncbi:MAG: hypothetical protein BWY87_01199 [Deltaproteobacteria bacterium ADurb.Bin510]|nr:MAG: hypothetical protein BWY87_01199 [Deltaproteobacteria bacterium ADurb.Bin510]